MKLFISTKDQVYAKTIAELLQTAGYEITSTWINESDYGVMKKFHKEKTRIATINQVEIGISEVMVFLSERDREMVSGDKHVEMGIAIAKGIPIIVLGHAENVFHYHPLVKLVETEEDLMTELYARQVSKRNNI